MGETLAALFVPLVCLALAVWAVQRWFRRFEGFFPASQLGVVIESEAELDAAAPPIGSYRGDEIHAWVRYCGTRYDFSHIAPPRYRLRVKPDELFLAPGVVYRKV
ncbi:MAG TPA: hypothetical protein VGJ74_06930 [Burkholderiales bacterium]